MNGVEGRSPWWKGARGEWWVIAQIALIASVLVLPPAGPVWPRALRLLALSLGAGGLLLVVLGAAALGSSLTIFPRPRTRGRLVREGIFGMVRHPIYGGVILLALAWAVWRMSLLHLGLAVIVALFFAAKARKEERWLVDRFPDYTDYRRRVRAFIPRP
jgi:protein-S-isoprenylcysteine O-methyltransferase Ste14